MLSRTARLPVRTALGPGQPADQVPDDAVAVAGQREQACPVAHQAGVVGGAVAAGQPGSTSESCWASSRKSPATDSSSVLRSSGVAAFTVTGVMLSTLVILINHVKLPLGAGRTDGPLALLSGRGTAAA